MYSRIKGMTMGPAIVFVACYYGYTVRGGSVEVGKNTAKSMILNMILIHVIGALGTQLFWGSTPNAPIGN
jgi:phospholipid/cholesterol/gamma-HCH transport system permease protein